MKAFLLKAVIQNHIKASRKRDDQLMQILVGVPAALGPAGNIIEIVDTLDVKGHMPASLDEGEIAAGIVESREVNDPALSETHEVSSSRLCRRAPETRLAWSQR